ncbi:MAG: Hsp33 family molecular chaperone HslO [Myxococcales bacterium]|nr:MAG: Hsp33 family molecular chaperone HslO [Myxococcales bacterium]
MNRENKDKVIRAMADDGSFRVIVMNTSSTCYELCKRQGATGELANQFAELLTGTIIVRETMAPWLRAQAIATNKDRKDRLVADVYPDGSNRGLLQRNGNASFSFGEGSLLQVMRGLPNGQTHEGIVDISTKQTISEAFMGYMQSSEQVNSVIRIAAQHDGNEILHAGGYIVQLLPEATREAHMIMTERLDDFPSIEKIWVQEEEWIDLLLDEILYGMPYTRLDESSLRFGCQCSEARVFGSLATLDKETISKIIEDEKLVEVGCDYCGETYRIAPEKLRSLLHSN